MSALTRLVLIRHGEPHEDAHRYCYGTLDIGLSAHGRRQAQQLATALARIDLAAVYSSPLQRATATAAPPAAVHGLTPIIDRALREIDFGEFEGQTYAEIERCHPQLYWQWMQAPTLVQFPGGESYTTLCERAVAAMNAIRNQHRGETAAIVSHGGALRAMLANCLSMPDEVIFRLDQSYGAINIVDWTESVPLVRLLNGSPMMQVDAWRGLMPAFVGKSKAEADT
jgi:broad specificity phosphatase PhoE